jgi:hypothetical protein
MFGDSLKRKGLARATGSFLFYTFAAMIVGPMITGIVIYVLTDVFGTFSLHLKAIGEIGGLANPLCWGPAFALGLALNYIARQRSACWVWLCGFVWAGMGIQDSVRYYNPLYSQGCTNFENIVNAFVTLNSHRCGGGGSTLAGLFFTFPAVSSVAYSVGAWVAIRYMGRFHRVDTNRKTVTLGLN